jgi:hypothetical protein
MVDAADEGSPIGGKERDHFRHLLRSAGMPPIMFTICWRTASSLVLLLCAIFTIIPRIAEVSVYPGEITLTRTLGVDGYGGRWAGARFLGICALSISGVLAIGLHRSPSPLTAQRERGLVMENEHIGR